MNGKCLPFFERIGHLDLKEARLARDSSNSFPVEYLCFHGDARHEQLLRALAVQLDLAQLLILLPVRGGLLSVFHWAFSTLLQHVHQLEALNARLLLVHVTGACEAIRGQLLRGHFVLKRLLYFMRFDRIRCHYLFVLLETVLSGERGMLAVRLLEAWRES